MDKIFFLKLTYRLGTSSGSGRISEFTFYDENEKKIDISGKVTINGSSGMNTGIENMFDNDTSTYASASSSSSAMNAWIRFTVDLSVRPKYFTMTTAYKGNAYNVSKAELYYMDENLNSTKISDFVQTNYGDYKESPKHEINVPWVYWVYIVDAYFDGDTFESSNLREGYYLNAGDTYSFTALDVEGYYLVGDRVRTGTVKGQTNVAFKYVKKVYRSYKVIDKYYDTKGNFVSENVRIDETKYDSETYSVNALSPSGYSVQGDTSYSGTISGDTTITFNYKEDIVYYEITVKDTFYDLDNKLLKSEIRQKDTLEKGSEYSYSALNDKNYICTSSENVTGTATSNSTIEFIYKMKEIYYYITVVDEFRTAKGKFEKNIVRKRDRLLQGTSYSYSAIEYEEYSIVGETTYSGNALSDTTITFTYYSENEKKEYYKQGVFCLIALDKNYQIITPLSPTNIQWSRKYHESGTFSVQLPLDQYSSDMKYIYTRSRPELGKISQVNYSVDSGYMNVQLSGYFVESELDRHVVYDLGTTNIKNDPSFYVASGNAEDVAYQYFNGFKRIEGTNTDGTSWVSDLGIDAGKSKSRGHRAEHHRLGDYLGKKIYKILKPSGMSFRVDYNFDNSKKVFKVWQGVDRTSGNSELNNPAIFSTRYGNVKNPNIVIDDSTYKNGCIASHENMENDATDYTIQAYLNLETNEEAYFTKLDSTQNKSNFSTTNEFKKSLENECVNEVNNAVQTINLDFDSEIGSYVYLEDFDLGDLCSIEIPEIGFSADARLIGCYEVIKSNNWSLNLEFGTPILK